MPPPTFATTTATLVLGASDFILQRLRLRVLPLEALEPSDDIVATLLFGYHHQLVPLLETYLILFHVVRDLFQRVNLGTCDTE